jgi:hypothetical protein
VIQAPRPPSGLLEALYQALRTIRHRGIGAGETRVALDRLRAAIDPVLDERGRLELRIVRRVLYLNGSRLESDLENFVFHAHVLETLRGAGIGGITFRGLPTRRDLQVFLPLVVRISDPDGDPARSERLRQILTSQGIRTIELQAHVDGTAEVPGEEDRRASAIRTYEESVNIAHG